ncbi:hypothetical protein [Halobacillus salinus]|uniref:Uncharacterized protein n=1 Tax=Halobacillus salinus TaxID=192814 RepID=A0A4Z0GXV9_9BACI|nr:hypothetical protein [Halobacillus salinus]TGB01419.1 hypothetical protein E4663_16570 [Halobacillus salinus]
MNSTAFKGLWKKEWIMMRGYYATVMVFNILWLLFAPLMMETGRYISTTSALMIVHMFYMAGMVLHSFNKEADHLDITLHSPRSGFGLASVKMLQSMTFYFFSLALVVTFGIFTAGRELTLELSQISGLFIRMSVFLSGIGLTFAFILFLLWSLHQLMKKYIGGLSVIVCIGLFFAITGLISSIQGSNLYETLTAFGPQFFAYERGGPVGMIYFDFGVKALTVGKIAFFLLLNGILLSLGMWVLDRKVEA